MTTVELAQCDARVAPALANVLVDDESALYFLLHSAVSEIGTGMQPGFSMNEGYAATARELSQFNTQHPLFGGKPTSVLVPERRLRIHTESLYCIDMVSRKLKVGLEYDGWEYHLDIAKDMRRRNALLSMGWEIFPLDKTILNDAEATEKLGYQVAKRMGVRLQKQRSWESKYAQLRQELGLRA